MRKSIYIIIGLIIMNITSSCKEKDVDLSPQLIGHWQQSQISIDGKDSLFTFKIVKRTNT